MQRNARARFSPNPSSFMRSLYSGWRYRRTFEGVEAYGMFVGHPRSGHTLVGSLLDAHPEIVLAHELDALAFIDAGYSRRQLFSLLVQRSRWFANRDFEWQGYRYAVPDQWQGKFSSLRVIGDKKASRSTATLRRRPALLDTLRRVIGGPLRIVHVVRNPFDNIARMSIQSTGELPEKTDFYFKLCDTVRGIRASCSPEEFLTVRHEDFIAGPAGALRRLCLFFGVEGAPEYLEACRGVVFNSPRRAREKVSWEPSLVRRIESRMRDYDFLNGYRFAS